MPVAVLALERRQLVRERRRCRPRREKATAPRLAGGKRADDLDAHCVSEEEASFFGRQACRPLRERSAPYGRNPTVYRLSMIPTPASYAGPIGPTSGLQAIKASSDAVKRVRILVFIWLYCLVAASFFVINKSLGGSFKVRELEYHSWAIPIYSSNLLYFTEHPLTLKLEETVAFTSHL